MFLRDADRPRPDSGALPSPQHLPIRPIHRQQPLHQMQQRHARLALRWEGRALPVHKCSQHHSRAPLPDQAKLPRVLQGAAAAPSGARPAPTRAGVRQAVPAVRDGDPRPAAGRLHCYTRIHHVLSYSEEDLIDIIGTTEKVSLCKSLLLRICPYIRWG